MPVPNASLTPDETVQWSPSGPAALALTTAGSLRVQRPRGPLVQAGTVNLIKDSQPLTVTSWQGGASAVTTVVNRPWDPSKKTRRRTSTITTGMGTGPIAQEASGTLVPVVAGTTYTFSALVMTEGNSGNVTLLLYGKNAADTVYAIEDTSSVVYHDRAITTNVPKRVAVSFTIPTGVVSIANLGFWYPSATAGLAIYMCDMQLEIGDHPTDFVDPDDPDTYWIAAANNSPSVRPDRYAELANAWLVEEATTNVLWPRNALYIQSNNQITWPLQRTDMGDGTLRLVPLEGATALNTYFINTYTLPATGPWTTSYEVMTPGPSPCSVYVATGVPAPGTPEFPVQPGTWTPVTRTVEIADISAPIRPNGLYSINLPVGQPLFVRYPQFENKPYATSYAEGGMGTGYSWQDAPFESPAIRAAATPYVTLPMPADQGSIYIRYLAGTTPTARYIGGLGQIGGAGSRGLLPNIDSSNQMNLRQGDTFNGVSTVADWDQPRGVYAEYSGGQVAVDYRDGAGKRYFTRIGDPPPPTWEGDLIPIGWSGNNSSPSPLNGYVFAIAALPRLLTDTELAALNAIPTEELSYASIVGIGPQLGGLLLTHPDPGFAVLRTHGGS